MGSIFHVVSYRSSFKKRRKSPSTTLSIQKKKIINNCKKHAQPNAILSTTTSSINKKYHFFYLFLNCYLRDQNEAMINDIHVIWSSYKMIAYIMCIMIDYGLFMMIYKPSKLVYSSVHIGRVYHFIRDHFTRIPLYT